MFSENYQVCLLFCRHYIQSPHEARIFHYAISNAALLYYLQISWASKALVTMGHKRVTGVPHNLRLNVAAIFRKHNDL